MRTRIRPRWWWFVAVATGSILLWNHHHPNVWYGCEASSRGDGYDTVIGITGRNFVLLGADASMGGQGIAFTSQNVDKIVILTDPFPGTDMEVKEKGESHIGSKSGRVGQVSALTDATVTKGWREATSRSRGWMPLELRSYPMAAATTGDAADADRFLCELRSHVAVHEYENSVGCDVHVVDGSASFDTSLSSTSTPSHGQSLLPTGLLCEAPALTIQEVAHLARQHIASRLRSSTPLQINLLLAGIHPTTTRRIRKQDNDDKNLPLGSSLSLLNSIHASKIPSDRVQQQVSRAQMIKTTTAPLVDNGDRPVQAQTFRVDSDDDDNNLDIFEPKLYWLDSLGTMQAVPYGAHGLGATLVQSILDQGYRPDMELHEALALMLDAFDQLRDRYLLNTAVQPPCIKCITVNACQRLRVRQEDPVDKPE